MSNTNNTTAGNINRLMSALSLLHILKRNTKYTVGDIANHIDLPSWAYLCCTKEGTTSDTDIIINKDNIKKNDTITDGTCEFTIRDRNEATSALQDGNGNNIAATYFTKSGGALTGGIRRDVDNSVLQIIGGANDKSAYLNLWGKDANDPYVGGYQLKAGGAHNSGSNLSGFPDGRLLHNGYDLAGSAIVAKSLGHNGYTKYANGLILQWGYYQGESGGILRFPISFTTGWSMSIQSVDLNLNVFFNHNSLVQTVITHNGTSTNTSYWFAIGY